jgi:hypothetical protein
MHNKMTTLINKTEKIMRQLEKEGKTEIMNKPEYINQITNIDNLMKKVSEDYSNKESNSWINARKCFVYKN